VVENNLRPQVLAANYLRKWGATKAVLAERERELLELKGPCSNKACRLHHAHSGPCDPRG
jgi:hypothetical protein